MTPLQLRKDRPLLAPLPASAWVAGVAVLLAVVSWARADGRPQASPAAPAVGLGVDLVLSLPKRDFLLGEMIPATLSFNQTDKESYMFYSGTPDPLERPWGVTVHAKDAAGVEVKDPFKPYRDLDPSRPGFTGPLFSRVCTLEVFANEWLCFPRPGTYTLWVTSERVRKVDRQNTFGGVSLKLPGTPFPLTSNQVTITIAPLPPETEAKWLKEAVERSQFRGWGGQSEFEKATRNNDAKLAARQIMSLQTPTAWQALLQPTSYYGEDPLPGMEAGLFGCSETEQLAAQLLASTRPAPPPPNTFSTTGGHPVPPPRNVELYALLKSARRDPPFAPAELEAARREFLQAADPHLMPAYFADLAWSRKSSIGSVSMMNNLSWHPLVAESLVAHQLELDENQVTLLFTDLNVPMGRRMLPLIRREAHAPHYNVDALFLLSSLEPAEARELVVADLLSGQLFYEKAKGKSARGFRGPYLQLPAGPLPALTPWFHAQMTGKPVISPADLGKMIDRYGTADLLPEVIGYYQKNSGAYEPANSCLRFWLRCDRPAALAAIKERRAAGDEFAASCLASIAEDRWDADIQALYLQDLDHPDLKFVGAAIDQLGQHGDRDLAGLTAAALFRVLDEAAADLDAADRLSKEWHDTANMANNLLRGQNWKNIWTPGQARRLEAIAKPMPKSEPAPAPAPPPVPTQTVWGKPVNGLRLGIVAPAGPSPSYPLPVFDLILENISAARITLPAPLTALDCREIVSFEVTGPNGQPLEKHADFFDEPLHRVREVGPRPDFLEVGQRLTFYAVPLCEHTPAVGRVPWQRSKLRPGATYSVRMGLTCPAVPGITWPETLTSGAAKLTLVAPSADQFAIQAEFTLKQREFFLGEPIPVLFTVRNMGGKRFGFPQGSDQDATGRANRFKVTAVDELGRLVPDPAPKPAELRGFGHFETAGLHYPYRETLLVNQWCAFARAGRYTIKLSRPLQLEDASEREPQAIMDEDLLAQKEVTAEFSITLRDDSAAGKKLLDDLTARMRSGRLTYADGVALGARATAQDPALVPLLTEWIALKTWPAQAPVEQTEAVKMLTSYGRETALPIFEQLVDSANPVMRRDLAQYLWNWKSLRLRTVMDQLFASADRQDTISALRACRGNPDPALRARLLNFAHGSDSEFREGAAVMLADYPHDPDVVDTLRQLLSDAGENHGITIEAARSLHTLGNDEGLTPLIDLLSIEKPERIAFELKQITGQDFGVYQAAWRQWWNAEQKSPPAKP